MLLDTAVNEGTNELSCFSDITHKNESLDRRSESVVFRERKKRIVFWDSFLNCFFFENIRNQSDPATE